MAVGYPVAARPVAGTPAAAGAPPPPIGGTATGKIGAFGTSLARGTVAVSGLQKPGNAFNRAFRITQTGTGTKGQVSVIGRSSGSFALTAPPAAGKAPLSASSVTRLGALRSTATATLAISAIGSGRFSGLASSGIGRLPVRGDGIARFTLSGTGSAEAISKTEGEGTSRFDLAGSAAGVVRITARGSARLATVAGSGRGAVQVTGSGFAPLAAPGAWASADVPAKATGSVTFGLRSSAKIVTTIAGTAETGFRLGSDAKGIVFDRVTYPRSSTRMRRDVVLQDRRTDVRQDRRTAEVQSRRYIVGGLNVNNKWPDKSPKEILDYEIEWGGVWRDDDTVVSVKHTVVAGTVEILQERPEALPPLRTVTGTVVWIGGGVKGEEVEIYAAITTKKGRVKDATRKFKIT